MNLSDLRRRAHHIPQRQRRGPHLFKEELQAERAQVFAIVAVFRLGHAFGAAGGEFHSPAVLVHALAGLFMDEFDLRAVNLVEGHARFAGLNLGFERIVKLIERSLLQIHDLRQVQVVEFLEMMPQRGIYLRLAGGRVEHVAVTDPFLLRQPNREQQQR